MVFFSVFLDLGCLKWETAGAKSIVNEKKDHRWREGGEMREAMKRAKWPSVEKRSRMLSA